MSVAHTSVGPALPKPEAARRDQGERRQMTVLFCDLVGSTELSTRFDAEDYSEAIRAYHAAATQVVMRFGGHVAQLLGDGLLVYFGYPHAHEGAAAQAVRAALDIVGAVAQLERGMVVRVGLHSGLCVVSDVRMAGRHETLALGETPNVAARVQAAAAPGTVVMTAAMHRLVAGLFVVEDLGAHELKGMPEPIGLYRVVEPSAVRGRLQAAAAAGTLTPFVGRERELRLLHDAWDDVRVGRGRAVLVVGEPGIGKSRLLREFRERMGDVPHTWIECAADPFSQNVPYHAVTAMLGQAFAWAGAEPAEQRLAALEGALRGAGLTLQETVPLVAPIANLDVADRYPSASLPPDERRRRTLEILVAWALGLARSQPTLIAIEDLHWIDPTTLALLHLLVGRGATAPLLLVLTARPEFRAPWPVPSHCAQLNLAPLDDDETRDMALHVGPKGRLAPGVVETIIDRTGGVPLFVEELTRFLIEQERGADASDIPSTLHDSLLSRLDRLGTSKEVAQVAAAIGRECPIRLLEEVSGLSGEGSRTALDRLVSADLLYARGTAPNLTYVFKHALVQDVAYGALLRSRRRALHCRIAEAIERLYAPSIEDRVDDVAHHLWRAGPAADVTKTVDYLGRAAERARGRGAYEESMRSLEKALAAVRRTPPSVARARRELDVAIALSAVQSAAQGYAAPQREHLLDEMLALCEQVEDPALLFMVRMQVWTFHSVRGDHARRARRMAEQLHEMAGDVPMLLMWAQVARGNTSYHVGDFIHARRYLEDGLALCDSATHSSGSFQDPGSLAAAYLGLVLWTLGYPEQALKRAEQAIEIARERGDFMGLANAYHFASALRLYRGEAEITLRLAEQTVAVASEHGMTIWVGQGTMWEGAALIDLGRVADGLTRLLEGASIYAGTGAQLGITYRIGFLARAHMALGRVELARDLLDAVPTILESGSEAIEAAELYRLRGEAWLLEADPDPDIAFASFHRASEIAREQEAHSWELRTATSRARALARCGGRDEARRTLRDAYAWFSEGFDTRDLREARRLIDELA
jgi:class 3 adenylate cyclase/predicted ATPase